MALFKNAATEWEKTMTENDLDQMEAQGLDVSKYREKLAARRAKEAEEAKRDRELYKNPTQLDKMKPYMQTPRSSETEFFKKLAGKAPWLGKSKWLRKFTEGYIVYAGIVSAPAEAWKGVKHKDDSFHGIGIYALESRELNEGKKVAFIAGGINRDINKANVKAKMKSIKECGQLSELEVVDGEDVVNEGLSLKDPMSGLPIEDEKAKDYLAIIDGQHRYMAIMALRKENRNPFDSF